MGHSRSCETAKTYSCVCPCGGALHGAILIGGLGTPDPSRQVEATSSAEPRRWTRLPESVRRTTIYDTVADRQPAVSGIVYELVITLIGQVRDNGEIDAVATLGRQISDEVGAEFEKYLGSRGPDHRSNRHLWCVVLATICRLYDQGVDRVTSSVDDIVDSVMKTLRDEVSTERSDDTRARDVYQYTHRVVAAFEPADYWFLEAMVKDAVKAVIDAVRAIGEKAVFKYLRLIGAIVCPDPDRHPDVIKYCLWPLLSGPFQDVLEESSATEMRKWLRNAYLVKPTN